MKLVDIEMLGDEPTNKEIAQYLARFVPELDHVLSALQKKIKDLEKRLSEMEGGNA